MANSMPHLPMGCSNACLLTGPARALFLPIRRSRPALAHGPQFLLHAGELEAVVKRHPRAAIDRRRSHSSARSLRCRRNQSTICPAPNPASRSRSGRLRGKSFKSRGRRHFISHAWFPGEGFGQRGYPSGSDRAITTGRHPFFGADGKSCCEKPDVSVYAAAIGLGHEVIYDRWCQEDRIISNPGCLSIPTASVAKLRYAAAALVSARFSRLR